MSDLNLEQHVIHIREDMVQEAQISNYGWYRGRRHYMIWAIQGEERYIGNIEVICMGFSNTEWMIVSSIPSEDHLLEPVGPFDSLEQAAVYYNLSCSREINE